jgi:hypothetical protein
VFFHAFSVTFSNGMSSFSRWITHATAPIAIGSFLPFTAFPKTNLSGWVAGGKYSDRNELGSESKRVFEAWVDVMEHQGASGVHFERITCHDTKAVSNLFRIKFCLDE